jgi:hypothetical protein
VLLGSLTNCFHLWVFRATVRHTAYPSDETLKTKNLVPLLS